jgi:hypothetical protein
MKFFCSLNFFLSCLLFLSVTTLDSTQSFALSIPFYQSQKSLFPSGQESFFYLESLSPKNMTEHFLDIMKDSTQYRLPAELFVSELDLSHLVLHSEKNALYYLNHCILDHCFVKSFSGQEFKALKKDLLPWPQDLGKLILWKPSFFIENHSKKLQPCNPGDRFLILNLQQEYAHVLQLFPPYQEGYIRLSDTLSKLDLTQYALVKKQWFQVSHKTQEGLMVFQPSSQSPSQKKRNSQQKLLPFSKITGLLTHPQTLLSLKNIPHTPIVVRSPVTHLGESIQLWNQGLHPQHGLIWWKKQEPQHKVYTLSEIQKRKIYALAHPKEKETPLLISADGIFYSKDGQQFIHLSDFHHQNWPVAIDSLGYLYVGYQRAHPLYLDFQPFVKPVELARLFPSPPNELKIYDYRFDQHFIRLQVGSEKTKHWVQGSYVRPLSSSWSFF